MIKKHPKAGEIETKLDELGLRPFSDNELRDISTKLEKTISIGLSRKGEPVTTDGGVLAAPTGVDAITSEQVANVPDGVRGITAACGGTNWIFAETVKEPNGQVAIGRSFVRTIYENERQHTYENFAGIIADGIAEATNIAGLTHEARLPISVSLGFPQINSKTPEGDIDARIPRADLPKFWTITDYDDSVPPAEQPSMAKLIREKLIAKGISGVGPIAIVNDTVAVALDVRVENGASGVNAPIGFVFGTGTNGAMYGGEEKGMVNLEIGHAEVMPKDSILDIMQQRGWAPDTRQIMEYWMGGAFIPGRVMAGLLSLKEYVSSPDVAIKQIIDSKNPALISDMASGRTSPLVGLSLLADDYLIAQMCAERAFGQAAQMIGVHLATVSKISGYADGEVYIPFEGSVLGKGHGVKKSARRTVETLVPGLRLVPYEASGLVGVGKLAMVRMFSS